MFNIKTNLYFGDSYLKSEYFPSKCNILIHCSKRTMKTKFIENLKEILIDNNNVISFLNKDSTTEEPTTNQINTLKKKISDKIDLIIGIGGGSVLDTSKFLSFLICTDKKCEDYDLNRNSISKAIPLILIPTTCGSGSELTQYAVASNSFTKRKFTVSSDFIKAESCFIFPNLLSSLPSKTLIDSSIDSLIHCFESVINHDTDDLNKNIALTGIKLIIETLDNHDFKNKLDQKQLENLSIASICGGIAISNYRTGMIHTISVALSEFSSQPHGFINGKIFKHVLKFYNVEIKNKLNEIENYIQKLHFNEAVNTLESFIDKLLGNQKLIFDHEPNLDRIIERINEDQGLKKISPKKFNDNDLKILIQNIYV